MLLAWPRAILLQVAHPLVAAGVAGHSSFADGGFAAVHRLWQTVQAMLALTFGDEATQREAIDGILRDPSPRARHAARDRRAVSAGTRYSAEDPDLVLWVHVTLLESMVLAHDALLEPLTAEERDAYCAESAWVPVALGRPRGGGAARPGPRAQACLQRVHDVGHAGGGAATAARSARRCCRRRSVRWRCRSPHRAVPHARVAAGARSGACMGCRGARPTRGGCRASWRRCARCGGCSDRARAGRRAAQAVGQVGRQVWRRALPEAALELGDRPGR